MIKGITATSHPDENSNTHKLQIDGIAIMFTEQVWTQKERASKTHWNGTPSSNDPNRFPFTRWRQSLTFCCACFRSPLLACFPYLCCVGAADTPCTACVLLISVRFFCHFFVNTAPATGSSTESDRWRCISGLMNGSCRSEDVCVDPMDPISDETTTARLVLMRRAEWVTVGPD